MRHGAVRKKQSGVNAEQRDRVYMTNHVAQRLGSTALQHAGPVTAGRQASGTAAIYHPTDPHVASIVEAAIKRRLSVFQPSWVTVCPWLVCVALNAELCTSCNGRGCCVCSRLFCTDCVSAQRDNPFTRGSHYFKKETVQNHMRAHHKRRPS